MARIRYVAWVALLLLCGEARGQVTTGTILGTVQDSTGAVVPAATVQITNVDTGIGRTVTTDTRGFYTAPNLSLGAYQVSVTANGFTTEVRRGITLNVGQNAVIDFSLSVGSVSEQVEVIAEAPLVETTNANVTALVSGKQVQDLPLNGRNLIDLAPLQAGISFSPAPESSARRGFATKLTIVGTRYSSNLFQLDGIDINDASGAAGSATGMLMGAETVREFSVVTNAYSAEFGKHTGGIFNAVTKSGTNALHGTLFEFLRNDKLDARNFFDGAENPPYKRNQFGGSLGGPIVKDRSFFFGTYEGMRERQSRTEFWDVPNQAVRQGPVNPVMRPFLDAYPLPNADLGSGVTQFVVPRTYPSSENYWTVRADHKFSDQDSLFGRFTMDRASRNPLGEPFMQVYRVNRSADYYTALGETRIFSPAVINQLVAGFSRSTLTETQAPWEGMFFPRQSFTTYGAPDQFSNIAITGMNSILGGREDFPEQNILNMFQVKDDVFYTRGAHSMRFGVNVQRFQDRARTTTNGNGKWVFGNLQNFLNGIPDNFEALLPPPPQPAFVIYPRQSLYALYAQDDFRLTPRLTLNLGLRYEFVTTYHEKFGKTANMKDVISPGRTQDDIFLGTPVQNPSLKNFAPRVGFAWDPTGRGKTSVRAGIGVFYDQVMPFGALISAFWNNAKVLTVGSTSRTNNSTNPDLSCRPAGGALFDGCVDFPNAFFTQAGRLGATPRFEGMQYNLNQPAIYKYSLDLEQEVTPSMSVNLGFSGTRGVHLMRVLRQDMLTSEMRDGRIFIPSNAQPLQPNFGLLRPRMTDATSDYFGFRVNVTQRLNRGLQFSTSYTLSKSTDDSSSGTGGADYRGHTFPRYVGIKDHGLSAFDIRHNFTSNFTYDLPGRNLTGAVGKVLSGWQVSGIIALYGGVPFALTTGVSPTAFRNRGIGDYVDIVADTNFKYNTRNPDGYLNPAVAPYLDASTFRVPAGFATYTQTGAVIGNAGRDIVIGPGVASLNLVLNKETAITERLRLNFRTEAFNLFNRANFSTPNGRVFQNTSGAIFPQFGRSTTTSTSSRQLQFGMRLTF